MAQYFSILTEYGTQVFAKALANNQPLKLAQFAVGDGNGQAVTPTANRTALARETYRANVSAVSLDPRNNKQVIVELTIPENIGGFYIREMGVFDNQNKLIAYANSPESYKPTEDSGSGKIQVLRMVLLVSSSNAVTLTVDHSVIFVTRQQLAPKSITATSANGFDNTGHSHAIDKASTTQAGIVQLSNDDNSDDETKAATPKVIKKLKGLYDGLRRLLDSYIPNSKKSSRLDSNSADDVATSAAVKAANDNANSRVPKVGDTEITGRHFFKNSNSWIGVISTESETAGYDLTVKNGDYPQVTYSAAAVGNNGAEARFFITPEGANYKSDRRQHAMTLGINGHLWTKAYGQLHDYFHHDLKSYVNVTQEGGRAGLNIDRRNGRRARFELIDNKQWKFWLEDKYDIFMPEKGGIVALLDDVKTVTRKDYSRTIKGTRPDWDDATSKNISVTGYVCIYPDGRIEQFFYFRNFRVNWFDFEPIRDSHFRQVEIPIQLWTAMPNKVTWVEAHISRTNDTNIWSQRTVGSEAGEWTKPIWGFEKQGSIKDRTNIYTRRINGDTGETVDMMIKVEGY